MNAGGHGKTRATTRISGERFDMIECTEAEQIERLNARVVELLTERDRLRVRLASARKALELAEDILSRAPFSTAILPNGMHPQIAIQQIRDAISLTDEEGNP